MPVNWIQDAIRRPGAFRRKALAAGMSTSEYADHVLSKGSGADTTTKRQANLAETLSKLRPARKKGK